jgi:opacity protein-like surface antigen
MKFWQPTVLSLALMAAFPLSAHAQSMDEMRKELKALKDQVNALEQKLKTSDAAKAADKPAEKQWGMTPEQVQDFNRISLKTEALEDSRDAMGFTGLKISGQMDPTYIYNRNQNRAGFQFLNSVSDDGYNYDNSYFGMAMLDIQKEMEGGTLWRLTLAPNRGVGSVFGGDNSIVHEASVSVPLWDQNTRLIAGQVPDWSGYEYLQPTLNKLITHNLLFDFTLPTAYTGAGMQITSGKWIVKGMVANMNATKRASGEKTPVLAYRVDYSKGEYQGFGFAGVHGKAANLRAADVDPNGNPNVNPITTDAYDSRDTAVNLFEADAYFIRGDWTLQGQVSYAQQSRAAITADPDTGDLRDAKWWGVSGLAAYKFQPRLEGIVRVDYLNNKKNGGGLLGYNFNDPRNGIGFDPSGDPEVGANRYALSVGMGYLFTTNTTFKLEYRYDRASQPVFLYVKDGTFKKSNNVLGTSVVVSF